MVRIQDDSVKDYFLIKLETGCQAAQVDGYHLTADLAAELGFEKITGLTDVILEGTCHLEDLADGWSVYGIKWDAPQFCECGKAIHTQGTGFTRVYVRKMKPPEQPSES